MFGSMDAISSLISANGAGFDRLTSRLAMASKGIKPITLTETEADAFNMLIHIALHELRREPLNEVGMFLLGEVPLPQSPSTTTPGV